MSSRSRKAQHSNGSRTWITYRRGGRNGFGTHVEGSQVDMGHYLQEGKTKNNPVVQDDEPTAPEDEFVATEGVVSGLPSSTTIARTFLLAPAADTDRYPL